MGGPRKNNFTRALLEAKQRLKQATVERDRAQKAMAKLSREIPDLQRTIQALEVQLGAKPLSVTKMATVEEVEHLITGSDLAKLAGPQDLTGMGSVPAASQDELLLPDAEGTPLVPE